MEGPQGMEGLPRHRFIEEVSNRQLARQRRLEAMDRRQRRVLWFGVPLVLVGCLAIMHFSVPAFTWFDRHIVDRLWHLDPDAAEVRICAELLLSALGCHLLCNKHQKAREQRRLEAMQLREEARRKAGRLSPHLKPRA